MDAVDHDPVESSEAPGWQWSSDRNTYLWWDGHEFTHCYVAPTTVAIGTSKAALVLGVLSVALYFTAAASVLGVAAIVLGVRATRAQRLANERLSNPAQIGMVLGLFGVLLAIIWVAFLLEG